MLVAEFAQAMHELSCRLIYSRHALDALDDHSCKVAFAELGCNCVKVVERCEYDIFSGIERCLDLRVVCCGNCS